MAFAAGERPDDASSGGRFCGPPSSSSPAPSLVPSSCRSDESYSSPGSVVADDDDDQRGSVVIDDEDGEEEEGAEEEEYVPSESLAEFVRDAEAKLSEVFNEEEDLLGEIGREEQMALAHEAAAAAVSGTSPVGVGERDDDEIDDSSNYVAEEDEEDTDLHAIACNGGGGVECHDGDLLVPRSCGGSGSGSSGRVFRALRAAVVLATALSCVASYRLKRRGAQVKGLADFAGSELHSDGTNGRRDDGDGNDVLLTAEHKLMVLDRDRAVQERRKARLLTKAATAASSVNPSSEDARSENAQEKVPAKIAAASRRRASDMKRGIQEFSRRAVSERYGEGPHYVRIDLEFPQEEEDGDDNKDDGDASSSSSSSSFVVKLAPLDLMPHSVHLFLDSVSRGLYDDCRFHLNAGHIVKASPPAAKSRALANRRAAAARRQQRRSGNTSGSASSASATAWGLSGLTSPAFPEYHPSYPHKRHTLGFVGHPDALGFYVNTKDNVEVHGPGMQPHHRRQQEGDEEDETAKESEAEEGDADPCFGEIVDGEDAVERLKESETVPDEESGGGGGGIAMKRPVRIRSARIVSGPILTQ